MISVECRSPIISLAHGTPAFYVRQPTDTCKRQMYPDIGVNPWFFEIDETTGQQLWAQLKAIHADAFAVRARVKVAMAGVDRLQQRMVDALRSAVGRALRRRATPDHIRIDKPEGMPNQSTVLATTIPPAATTPMARGTAS